MSLNYARLLGRNRKPAKAKPRPTGRRSRLAFEQFEARMMMHGGGLGDDAQLLVAPNLSSAGSGAATIVASKLVTGKLDGKLDRMEPTNRDIDIQMGLPMLDSLPGAAATLYLDFDGNFLSHWFDGATDHFNVNTPVFDTDGDPTKFSTTEQAQIKEVWARVAEDYAPFNINVSTDYYGSFDNKVALRVAIGGDNGDWLHDNASGTSFIGSFSNDQPNVVFAFDMFKWAKAGVTDGDGRVLVGPAAMATTISHEAGHGFGLRHHALYKVNGDKITNYNPGGSGWTPIMGENKASDRTTWDASPTDLGSNTYQDDVAVISGAANGFGLRPDDHASTVAAADWMTAPVSILGVWSGKGIVNSYNDYDMLKFTTAGGNVQVNVRAAANGPNLIPVAQLWSASGFVANANAGSLTESIISANLSAGTYYVLVHGYGDYGDMGQYTVSASTKQFAAQATTKQATAGALAGSQLIPAGSANAVGGTLPTSKLAVAQTKSTAALKTTPSFGSPGADQALLLAEAPRRESLATVTLLAVAKDENRGKATIQDGFTLPALDAVFNLLGTPKLARRVG